MTYHYQETPVGDIPRTLEADRWLIPGILPVGYTICCGDRKKGKTHLALCLAAAVSDGVPIGGVLAAIHDGARRNVLYYSKEDTPTAIADKLERLTWPFHDTSLEAQELQHFHIARSASRLNLYHAEARDQLLETVRTEAPRLLVFDTFRQLTAGMSENDSDSVSTVTDFFLDVVNLGTSVLVNHHFAKGRRSGRGSGNLEDAAQCVLYCENISETSTRIGLRVTGEAKEVPAPIPWEFAISPAPDREVTVAFADDDWQAFTDGYAQLAIPAPSRGIARSAANGSDADAAVSNETQEEL